MREFPRAFGTKQATEYLADLSRTGEPPSIQFVNQLIHQDKFKAQLVGHSWVINGLSFATYYKRRYEKKYPSSSKHR